MEIADILLRAVKLEKEGREAYLLAAGAFGDKQTKSMFETLATDELHHLEYLERQLQSIQSGGTWIDIPQLEGLTSLDADKPIFPPGKSMLEKLPKNASLEDALLFGLTAETNSFELYRDYAEKIQDPAAQKMFQGLAHAEQNHFNLLMMRYESHFGYPR